MNCSSSKDHSSPNKWWSKETVAVVTGANKGIGFAIVKRLAELGLTVVLTTRDVEKGKMAVESLTARGLRSVWFCQLDITDLLSIQNFASWLHDVFGELDILINNAAVSFNKLNTNSVEHAETVIKTNFYGPKLLVEALLPLFRRESTVCRILNLSSQLGLLNKLTNPKLKQMLLDEESLTEQKIEEMVSVFLNQVKNNMWQDQGWPKVWTDYAVSKLALNAYTRLMARRYEGRGLSVNCFCPGFTCTDMTGRYGSRSADEAGAVAAELALISPEELPTGKFFKWCTPMLYSKL
ncbi:hypothetical protein LUZ60_004418 [Juncus effusus]|nr:hypothetical protein LUZ60_004418 [Juncus effusus]